MLIFLCILYYTCIYIRCKTSYIFRFSLLVVLFRCYHSQTICAHSSHFVEKYITLIISLSLSHVFRTYTHNLGSTCLSSFPSLTTNCVCLFMLFTKKLNVRASRRGPVKHLLQLVSIFKSFILCVYNGCGLQFAFLCCVFQTSECNLHLLSSFYCLFLLVSTFSLKVWVVSPWKPFYYNGRNLSYFVRQF